MQFPTNQAPIPSLTDMTDDIQRAQGPYFVLDLANRFYFDPVMEDSQPQFAFIFKDAFTDLTLHGLSK